VPRSHARPRPLTTATRGHGSREGAGIGPTAAAGHPRARPRARHAPGSRSADAELRGFGISNGIGGLRRVINGAVMGSRRGHRFETFVRFPFPGRQGKAEFFKKPIDQGMLSRVLYGWLLTGSSTAPAFCHPAPYRRPKRGCSSLVLPPQNPASLQTPQQPPHHAPPAPHSLGSSQPAASRPLPSHLHHSDFPRPGLRRRRERARATLPE